MSFFDHKLPIRVPKLSPVKQAEFKSKGYAAVYVAGPAHPVPRKMGDNMGGWPIRVGVTQSWDDTITNTLDTGAALWWQGCLFRVWTASREHALRLEGAIAMYVAERSEALRKAWLDLGPDLDLTLFEWEVHSVGERIVGKVWGDEDLYHELLRAERARNARSLNEVTDILERRKRAS